MPSFFGENNCSMPQLALQVLLMAVDAIQCKGSSRPGNNYFSLCAGITSTSTGKVEDMSTSQNESLRDIALIAQQRHDGVGGRQMQRIAERAGKTMSPTTFDRIVAGIYRSKPQAKTLEALAFLAGLSEERVYEAAGRKYVAAKFADQLPPDVDELDQDQREALIYAARAFLKTNREIERLRNELRKRAQEPNRPDLRAVDSPDNDTQSSESEQKIPSLDPEFLAAHPNMPIQADQDDEFFDGLGEENQDGGD